MEEDLKKDNNSSDESFLSHLEALRKTLVKCFLSIGVTLPFCFIFAPKILNYLINFLIADNKIKFNYFTPVEVFILQIKLAFVVSLVVSSPYIIKNLWGFIKPALYDNERKFIKSIVFVSSFLFILGVCFCGFFILPLIIRFGLSFSSSQIQPVFNITSIVNLILWLSVVFGLMFQLPLVVYSLIKWDIVSYYSISSKRPYVVVILLIISAFLTPPDVVSQVMLFIPSYLLFELGLIFSKKVKNAS